MARLTDEDKLNINLVYLRLGTYSGVAKELGFAATTVKKYVIPGFQPPAAENVKNVSIEDISPDVDLGYFLKAKNIGDVCVLTEKEKEEVKELWNELLI